MVRRFVRSYADKVLSRWIVLGLDILTVAASFLAAYIVRFSLDIQMLDLGVYFKNLPAVLLTQTVFFVVFNSFRGIIRHTGISDAVSISKAVFFAFITLLLINLAYRFLGSESRQFIPNSVLVIYLFIANSLLISGRVIIRMAYFKFSREEGKRTNVLIYGAGQSGIITKNSLLHDRSVIYNIVGFVDDNPKKVNKKIDGVLVYSSSVLSSDLIEDRNIDEVILSIQNISPIKKREIIDKCLTHDISVKTVPPVGKWINGQLSTKQIQKVKIEDLLDREPIVLDNPNVKSQVSGKVVLVTGAAGSIGSEIARQLAHYNPAKLVLVDQAETSLHDLQIEFGKLLKNIVVDVDFVIGDVSNEKRMRDIFSRLRPAIVYHAAAYKHVPMMEENPEEAVNVNVCGTQILADLSVEYGTEKFVMVSTDKAVNPTNVMGATKRVAEIYTQSYNFAYEGTKFITTRFGNVLGSNGSVIPLFHKQIEAGGPLTVTHPDITRYFMTIPEACQLVLEAGAMGKGGEIFIFDMGESIKIYDVALKMIRLSGLTPGKDIQIKITGLRPGEKLMEELLNDNENTIKTHHPKIMIAKVRETDFTQVMKQIEELKAALNAQDEFKVVDKLKMVVPEFISNNSKFESLDKERFQATK